MSAVEPRGPQVSAVEPRNPQVSAVEPRSPQRIPVYAVVAARIRQLALRDGLGPGDRLPAERALAHRLGVSRTTLREALTALRIEGTVDVQHGAGIYLLRSPADTVAPISSDFRLLHPELPALGEVRNALEGLAADLAAGRWRDDDLAQMVEAIHTMEADVLAGGDGADGDRMFHAAVLRAARNPVLTELLESIAEGSLRIAIASLSRAGQPARSIAAHRLILEAMIVRDGELARRLMSEHLELTGEISDEIDVDDD